jgi:hypothetical protein
MVATIAAITITFSLFGTASATHDCLTKEGVDDPQHCVELTILAIDLTLAAAQDAYDECAALYAATPFLIPVICESVLSAATSNANATQGEAHQDIFDAAVAAHLALPPHHGPANKADLLIDSGVPGKGLENAPGLQKPFNENSKAGEKAGTK